MATAENGLPANIAQNIPAIKAITAMPGSPSTPMKFTAAAHGMQTGDACDIYDVQGAVEANGRWQVTVVDANTFTIAELGGTVDPGVNAYTTGGHVKPLGLGPTFQIPSDGDTDNSSVRNVPATALADRTAYLGMTRGGLYVADAGSTFVNNSGGTTLWAQGGTTTSYVSLANVTANPWWDITKLNFGDIVRFWLCTSAYYITAAEGQSIALAVDEWQPGGSVPNSPSIVTGSGIPIFGLAVQTPIFMHGTHTINGGGSYPGGNLRVSVFGKNTSTTDGSGLVGDALFTYEVLRRI